jgi:ribosomal protein L16 Arg81 hydroxylase
MTQVHNLHEKWTPVAKLCDALADELFSPVKANIYLTPSGTQGFPPHSDCHDLLVLQISGAKEWLIRPEPVIPLNTRY